MLKRTVNLLEDKSLYIAITLTIVIAYLSLLSTPLKIPKFTFGYFDKIGHLFFYTMLTLSWFLALSLNKIKILKSILIILAILFYGIIIEVLQKVATTNRNAEFYDVIANISGIILGFSFFVLWIEKRKQLK